MISRMLQLSGGMAEWGRTRASVPVVNPLTISSYKFENDNWMFSFGLSNSSRVKNIKDEMLL